MRLLNDAERAERARSGVAGERAGIDDEHMTRLGCGGQHRAARSRVLLGALLSSPG
jgi:hypothetical protein